MRVTLRELERLEYEAARQQIRRNSGGAVALQDHSRVARRFLADIGVPLALLERLVAKAQQIVLQDHAGAQGLLAEPNHAAAGHGSQGRILEILHLENDAHIRRQCQTLA
jgi:hypothetical protein